MSVTRRYSIKMAKRRIMQTTPCDVQVEFTDYERQTVPDRGVVRSCDTFLGSNHITGTSQTKVIKFCTQVGYINSSNRMTYHPQEGRGYGHVTVLKFCRFCRDAERLADLSEAVLAIKRGRPTRTRAWPTQTARVIPMYTTPVGLPKICLAFDWPTQMKIPRTAPGICQRQLSYLLFSF